MAISDRLPRRAGRSFGEPIVTDSGSTIVPVTRSSNGDALGIFVVDGASVHWSPVVDSDRIALIGVATGFVAASLACLAVLRQPPWPKVTIDKRLPSSV